MNQIHVIDTEVRPVVPNGWKIEGHLGIGKFEWKPGCFVEYLLEVQRSGTITGKELLKKMEGKPALPATVLDYLLGHQELLTNLPKVDEKNKRKYYFFLGTLYSDSNDNLYVRCLYWDGARWEWSYDYLTTVLTRNSSALFAA